MTYKNDFMKPIYLILSCLLIVNSSCHKDEELRLRVNNVSDKAIYVSWTIDYPDTSLIHTVNPTYNPQIKKVEAHGVQKDYYGAPSKGLFNDKVDTLSVFVFDAQVLETTPWDTVKANYLVLKRFDLSLDDLNKLNWIITYP
jgi:hypothetical protein